MVKIIVTFVLVTLGVLTVINFDKVASAPDASFAIVPATAFVLAFLLVGLIFVWAPREKESEDNQIKPMARRRRK